MEKVKITREQEEALNIYRVTENGNIDHFMRRRHTWTGTYKSILSFTPQQFSFLLSGWYEVEEPLNVGDWVYNKERDKYHKLLKINGEAWSVNEIGSLSIPFDLAYAWEKVIEPWKIMLLELGREKPEFKVNDVYIMSCGTPCRIKNERGFITIKNDLKAGRVVGFHSMESRIEVNACER